MFWRLLTAVEYLPVQTGRWNRRRQKSLVEKMIQRIIRAVKNRKRKQRSRRYVYTKRTFSLIGFAYVLLLFFPQPLFAHSARVGQFNFHSDRPITPEIKAIVERATAKLSLSPLYAPSDSYNVYIAADRWRRTLLMPRSPGAYGVSVILTGNTVLNRCDIEHDICTNDQPKFNQRPMHAVLAHESTHHLIARELGIVAFLRLPTWKNEGYCEYVAGDPSFDVTRGERLIRNGKTHGSHAFRYLTYLLAVRSCLDDQGLEPRELLTQSQDFQASLDSYIRNRQPETAVLAAPADNASSSPPPLTAPKDESVSAKND